MRYLETADVPIDDLTRYPGNARRGNVEEIRASVRRYGQYRALVVRRTPDGALVVLAGNHTRDALHAEGHTHARCELLECDDDEARRINVTDNRMADLGDYDNDALAALLAPMAGDLDGTGFTDADLAALLAADDADDGHGAALDDAPDPPDVPVSVPGDVWLLGPHRVICGDATDPAVLATLTAGVEVGIVYTDPPYGISIVNAATGKIGHSTQNPGGHAPTTRYLPVAGDGSVLVAAAAFRLLSTEFPRAVQVWWGGNHYAAAASLRDSSCWLIWDKENGGISFADAELAWTSHAGSVRLLRHQWHGMIRASERGKRVHPTQKPVALAEWAFSVVDPKAARRVVLDPFAGSGSTLIAAHRTDRVALACELEPHYVDVICRRFQEHAGTTPVLESTGELHDFVADAAEVPA
jgi:16S rRNA G966 N2-methylase RsmD